MGREGFEPSTLGLRVRSDRRQRAATSCNKLHRGLQRAATNYAKSGNAETNLYAHPYAQAEAKGRSRKRSNSVVDRSAVVVGAQSSRAAHHLDHDAVRSEERRVGKECRS